MEVGREIQVWEILVNTIFNFISVVSMNKQDEDLKLKITNLFDSLLKFQNFTKHLVI